jgi:hypothetical protein
MVQRIAGFLINEGLYGKGLKISSDDFDELNLFLKGEYKIDAYCCECKSERIFTSEELRDHRGKALTSMPIRMGIPYDIVPDEEDSVNEIDFEARKAKLKQIAYEDLIEQYPQVQKTFTCSLDESHTLTFCCLINNNQLIKFGQYPSLADLNKDNSKKYRKVLGEKYEDYSRGIGLHSHGIGAGSLVYLRRIFEDLIEEAHQNAISEPGWDESCYSQKRMDEKIQTLKDYLPTYLVENRKIYGLLSKGIHELDEEICLKIFPIVKVGIEFILDEKTEKAERERKKKETASLIDSLSAEIANHTK